MENPNLKEDEETQTPQETEEEPTSKKSTPEGEQVPPEEVNYKKKFSASTTENQRLNEETKKDREKIAELELAISEKELSKNPDFELMSEQEKEEYKEKQKIAKDVAILKAKEKMREDYRALPQEMKEKLEKKGGYDAFRDFACLPDNAGQKNLLNLAKSFLFEEKPEEPTEPEEKPGLEKAGGGERTAPPKKKGFTVEEVKQMRENDYDRYMKLAQEGKLNIVG